MGDSSLAINNLHSPIGIFHSVKGGGGHESLKKAKVKDFEDSFPQGKAVEIDMTKILNWIWIPGIGHLGDYGEKSWNEAMKSGDRVKLINLASKQWVLNFFFSPVIFTATLIKLLTFNEEPILYVCTQPLCLKAILKAIKWANYFRDWNLKMDLYVSDFPTKQCTHYTDNLKGIKGSDVADLLRIHAAPTIKENFWRDLVGDEVEVHTMNELPVRPSFKDKEKLKAALNASQITLNLKYDKELEKASLEQLSSSIRPPQYGEDRVAFNIRKEDRVGYLMLGSQPNRQAVLDWIDTVLAASKEAKLAPHEHAYFFIFSGPAKEDNILLQAAYEKLKALKNSGEIPEHISFVPFTFQDEAELALLMARACPDMSITSGGGLTGFEHKTLIDTLDLPTEPGQRLTIINSGAFSEVKDPDSAKKFRFISWLIDDVAKGFFAKLGKVKHFICHTLYEWFCLPEVPYHERNFFQRFVTDFLELFEDFSDTATHRELNQYVTSINTQDVQNEMEELVQKKMEKLIEKKKYADLAESDLRKIATRKVLIDEGIILWEAGNTKYLVKTINAEVSTPRFAKSIIAERFFGPRQPIVQQEGVKQMDAAKGADARQMPASAA